MSASDDGESMMKVKECLTGFQLEEGVKGKINSPGVQSSAGKCREWNDTTATCEGRMELNALYNEVSFMIYAIKKW